MYRLPYIVFFLCSMFFSATAQDSPCLQDEGRLWNLATEALVSQSSTSANGTSNIAIDGTKTGAWSTGQATRTLDEPTAWWEADLGDTYSLESIQIWFPSDVYPEGFSDYYVLYSPYPIGSSDLATAIATPSVQYLHVASNFDSGSSFPLGGAAARYVRIQNSGGGVLSLIEIDIPGTYGEICGNGCDDDKDGFFDCADSDCQPNLYNVTKVDPTCPICPDGAISIQAFGEDLRFSIDGGQSFEEACDGIFLCEVEGLLEGDFEVLVTNTSGCSVVWEANPVQLRAAAGAGDGACENGGFEEGDWTNWEGLISTVGKEEIELGYHSSRHFIKAGGFDPIVPNIILPFSGTYTAQLNAPISGGWQIGARYCFEVDDENKDFSFNYSAVLQDPNAIDGATPHMEEEKPFFSYEMYYLDNSNTKQLIPGGSLIVRADRDNKFFKPVEHEIYKGLVYRGWTCEFIDLSDFIGTEVCIDFFASDCTLGEHFGYAYIDGLCTTDYEPVLAFDANSIYCGNQIIEIDATGSYGFDQYTWKVCILDDNGEDTFCAEENVVDFKIDLFDASQFISDNGGSFECGTTIKVSLSVENNCSDPMSIEQIIEYICPEYEINYKDIFICGTEALVDVEMEGLNDCSTCEFSWEPTLGLNNSKLEFPTVIGSANDSALKQNYNVTATTPEGCAYEETVEIYFLPEVEFDVRDDYSYCGRVVLVNLIYNQPIDLDWVFVEFKNLSSNERIEGRLLNNSEQSNIIQYELIMDPLSIATIEVRVGWNISTEENILVELTSDCISTVQYQLEANDLFHGEFNQFIKVPNTFTPDSGIPGTTIFRPVLNPNSVNGSNVYWGQMEIFNRWGQKVHECEYSSNGPNLPPHSTYNMPLDVTLLAWDGTQNQQPAASDVYLYHIWFANCTYPNQKANAATECCSYTGNLTLLR